MKTGSHSRGKPLLALSAILATWVGVRVVMLDSGHFSAHAPKSSSDLTGSQGEPIAKTADSLAPQTAQSPAGGANSDGRMAPVPYAAMPQRPVPGGLQAPISARTSTLQREADSEFGVPVTVAAGHHMLWMAALARMPLPAMFAAEAAAPRVPAPFYPAGSDRAAGKRWSADSWLMLREGGAPHLATGVAPATYGASQVGAVVRYRLNGADARKPTVYLRGTAALEGVKEKEAALGFSARPVPSLPIVAALELRASDQPSGTRLRPAAMAVTELAPIELPHGTRAEFYAQAGYVGGKFATTFADGQMRVDTRIADVGKGELRAGGGAWAGAQKGASRVDIGPAAAMGVPLGAGGFARLGLDWRLRVGGDASPGSGPALTLSAGF